MERTKIFVLVYWIGDAFSMEFIEHRFWSARTYDRVFMLRSRNENICAFYRSTLFVCRSMERCIIGRCASLQSDSGQKFNCSDDVRIPFLCVVLLCAEPVWPNKTFHRNAFKRQTGKINIDCLAIARRRFTFSNGFFKKIRNRKMHSSLHRVRACNEFWACFTFFVRFMNH